jgi:F-type H+-transporting ATPase subunit delta
VRDTTIARNYADTLLALAQRAGDPAAWGQMMREVSDAVQRDERVHQFLMTPKLPTRRKMEILGAAFRDRFPLVFVRFLQIVVQHRRQALIPAIAVEYGYLLDAVEGRVHADVTVARAIDESVRTALANELTRRLALGRQVIPDVRIDPAILGGVVVRLGDTVMDGSVRSRLALLRRRLMVNAG